MSRKVIVSVDVHYNKEGKMEPKAIIWEDDRKFDIERVIDQRRAASLKAGGQGIRFTVRIKGREVYLYYDEPIWFMEGK